MNPRFCLGLRPFRTVVILFDNARGARDHATPQAARTKMEKMAMTLTEAANVVTMPNTMHTMPPPDWRSQRSHKRPRIPNHVLLEPIKLSG